MNEKFLMEKVLSFSGRIVKLRQYLEELKKETTISAEIVRSATRIGTNVNASAYAFNKNEYITCMHSALKETSETEYWLKLLAVTEYITGEMLNSFLTDCIEIKRLLVSSINNLKG